MRFGRSSRLQRASIVLTVVGLALTGGVAATLVRDNPAECQVSQYAESSREFIPSTDWHECSHAELTRAKSTDFLADALSDNLITYREGGRNYDRAWQAGWLGLLLIGIANAVLWGVPWARRGNPS